PLGVAAVRRPGWQGPVFAVLNLLQTIPSIALFGLLIVPLSGVASAFPSFAAVGIGGIGAAPALIALVLYALLPVVRSTVAGLTGLERTSKRCVGRRVVDDLWLPVPDGAFCLLLGPSGCGKSTPLRMVHRLVPFDSGAIRIAGEDIRDVPEEALRRRIGYAIQSIGLFPHWTVEDNIATVPRLLNWPGRRIRDRVTE